MLPPLGGASHESDTALDDSLLPVKDKICVGDPAHTISYVSTIHL